MNDAPTVPGRFAAVWTLVTLLAFFSVGGMIQVLNVAWGLWASLLVVFGGFGVVGWQLQGLSSRAAMGLTRFEARPFALGFAFGAVNFAAWSLPSMALMHELFPKRLLEMFSSARILERMTQTEVVVFFLGAAVAAPLCEEIFFRGFLFRAFREAPRGVVVTALIFSAAHVDPVGFLPRFELGVLFGLLAWKSRSLWPAIGAHAANNSVSAVLYFLGDKNSDAPVPWVVPVACFVVGNVALLALTRVAGPKLEARAPCAEVPVEKKPLVTWLAPWVALAVAWASVLLALDWRGAALNFIDAAAKPTKEASAATKELRIKARAGEVTVAEYREALKQHAP